MISTTQDADFDVTIVGSFDLTVRVTDKFGNSDTGVLTVNVDWENRFPYYEPNVYYHRMPEECNVRCIRTKLLNKCVLVLIIVTIRTPPIRGGKYELELKSIFS